MNDVVLFRVQKKSTMGEPFFHSIFITQSFVKKVRLLRKFWRLWMLYSHSPFPVAAARLEVFLYGLQKSFIHALRNRGEKNEKAEKCFVCPGTPREKPAKKCSKFQKLCARGERIPFSSNSGWIFNENPALPSSGSERGAGGRNHLKVFLSKTLKERRVAGFRRPAKDLKASSSIVSLGPFWKSSRRERRKNRSKRSFGKWVGWDPAAFFADFFPFRPRWNSFSRRVTSRK